MSRLSSMIAPPRRGDPREMLQWIRRLEIVAGILGLVAAALTWSGEWWSWLILGSSVLSLSLWPGPAAILRKSQERPDVLISDPARRRARGRRFLRYFVPISLVILAALGCLVDGLAGTIGIVLIGGTGLALGVWLYTRLEP
jgi:hypothetical protein